MVDLHIHSTASDGTDTIPELLQAVRGAGIRVFSVTDHDTAEGALEMERIVPGDMRYIRGIEFSCVTSAGKCHILGYDYDPDSPAFLSILEKGRAKRRQKLEHRLRFLRERFGIVLGREEEERLRAMPSAGKPHLGALLSQKGLARDKNEAIRKYLDPLQTGSDRVDGLETVAAILASGGIPVWAHPLGGTEEGAIPEEQFQAQLSLLSGAGLKGLECYYSKYTEAEVRFLLDAAAAHGLCVSGGSDYHGKTKSVRLGVLNAYGEAVPMERLSLLGMAGMKFFHT